MTTRVRWGLIGGVVGLLVITFASLVFALSGPVISFVIGIIIGFIVTKKEPAPTRGVGAQDGAIAGLITGVFILLGQIIAAISSLYYAQMGIYEEIFGPVPDLSSIGGPINYWLIGIGVGLIFGLVDALACVLGGVLTGYLRTPAASHDRGEQGQS